MAVSQSKPLSRANSIDATAAGSQPRSQLRVRRISLLGIDKDLASRIDPPDRPRAAEALRVPVVPIEPGDWQAPSSPPSGGAVGLLVSEAQLIRKVAMDRTRSVELLGDGDLIRPWQEDLASFCRSSWRVLAPGRLAVLDETFLRAVTQWPQLVMAVVERTLRRSRFMALEAAASNLVGIEGRVLTALWVVAEKWGRVENGGVVVTTRLTHELLGELIGARRPTVTQALSNLAAAGKIARRADGRWVLLCEPPAPPTSPGTGAAASHPPMSGASE